MAPRGGQQIGLQTEVEEGRVGIEQRRQFIGPRGGTGVYERQSAATRSLARARLAQTGPRPVSMRQMSEDMPPFSGWPRKASPLASPNSRKAWAKAAGTG